ncbi:MAG: MYG1 family protein, partial [Planctomycetota bacterium]
MSQRPTIETPMHPHLIVTHPGNAHKDDFLACSILAHLHRVPIERRDPTEEDLEDGGVYVVDVGGRHEPEKANFDHHQFPKDHPPICALSLVLEHVGIYEDAKRFFSWLQPAEWLDTRGPNETSALMKIPRSVFDELASPIDITL